MKHAPDGGVDRVDIHGKVDGIQLEASGDSTSAPADSTGRAASTLPAASTPARKPGR
jgi:hypothetical protein